MSKELDDMLAGITPENRHAEVDFGEAVGREAVAPSAPVSIEDMNKAIAHQGAKGGCSLEQPYTMFKTFPPNERGDDFVVGDMHGHHQALMDELARIGFDFEKDRLFCTGDLIDRGPDSFGTLSLVFEPWFHFVRGNHEDDLAYFWENRQWRATMREMSKDQAWIYSLQADQIERMDRVLMPTLAAAPVVLRVEGEHGFWMVHADRGEFASYGVGSRLWLLDDDALQQVDGNNTNQVGALLWSRRLMREMHEAGFLELKDHGHFLSVCGQEYVAGVGLTFVGHYTVQRPILYRSHLFIDTGMGTHPDGNLTVLRVKDVLV